MKNMSDQLVSMIEKNAEALTQAWLRDVRKCERTPTYHHFDQNELFHRAYRVYNQLGKWISHDTTRQQIAEYYIAQGRQRCREGFFLAEVLEALIITRRHVWLKVLSEGLLDTALELLKALELNNRVVLFFDRAMYYTAVGYEQERTGKSHGTPAVDGFGGGGSDTA